MQRGGVSRKGTSLVGVCLFFIFPFFASASDKEEILPTENLREAVYRLKNGERNTSDQNQLADFLRQGTKNPQEQSWLIQLFEISGFLEKLRQSPIPIPHYEGMYQTTLASQTVFSILKIPRRLHPGRFSPELVSLSAEFLVMKLNDWVYPKGDLKKPGTPIALNEVEPSILFGFLVSVEFLSLVEWLDGETETAVSLMAEGCALLAGYSLFLAREVAGMENFPGGSIEAGNWKALAAHWLIQLESKQDVMRILRNALEEAEMSAPLKKEAEKMFTDIRQEMKKPRTPHGPYSRAMRWGSLFVQIQLDAPVKLMRTFSLMLEAFGGKALPRSTRATQVLISFSHRAISTITNLPLKHFDRFARMTCPALLSAPLRVFTGP